MLIEKAISVDTFLFLILAWKFYIIANFFKV